MARKGSVSNLAVLVLICFRVDIVTSQSCDQNDCSSIDDCINANNASLLMTNRFQTSLRDTAYSYLTTYTSKYSDAISTLSSYWSTFSGFKDKFRAYALTSGYSVYTMSTSQRNDAISYNDTLNDVIGVINAFLPETPTMPTTVATDVTDVRMTDLYAETNFVSRQFNLFLLSWERCSNCHERRRRNSEVPKKSVIGRGKKEKKITTKKLNKVTKTRKGRGRNKGKGKGKNNKKQ